MPTLSGLEVALVFLSFFAGPVVLFRGHSFLGSRSDLRISLFIVKFLQKLLCWDAFLARTFTNTEISTLLAFLLSLLLLLLLPLVSSAQGSHT